LEEKEVTASQAISIQQPKKRAAKATLSIASEIDFSKVRMFFGERRQKQQKLQSLLRDRAKARLALPCLKQQQQLP
jgi:hypothetical protein